MQVLIIEPLNTKMYGVCFNHVSEQYEQAIEQEPEKFSILSVVPKEPGLYFANIRSLGDTVYVGDNKRSMSVTFSPIYLGQVEDKAVIAINPEYSFEVEGFGAGPLIVAEDYEEEVKTKILSQYKEEII